MAMGRVSDIVWYDLSVTKAWGAKDIDFPLLSSPVFNISTKFCRIFYRIPTLRVRINAERVETATGPLF